MGDKIEAHGKGGIPRREFIGSPRRCTYSMPLMKESVNYYERHLGDYARDTGHLSMLEHGAYSLLLDRYYITERGIPADQAHRIARARSDGEREAVDSVLAEFFTLSDGLWIQSRAAGEIELAQQRIAAARANGKRGGRPRKGSEPNPEPIEKPNETQKEPSGLSLGSESITQEKALQSPVSTYPPIHLSTVTEPSGSVPARKARGSRRCPESFEVSESMRQWAALSAPRANVERETLKMRNHEFSKAKSDWMATWQNWMLNADERSALGVRQGAAPMETFRERDDRLAAERLYEATGGNLGRAPSAVVQQPTQEIFDVTPSALGR